MDCNYCVIMPKVLSNYVAELFEKAGMNKNDAQFQSETIVKTDMYGIGSHGVLRVPIYLERLLNNAIKANPETRIAKEAGAIEILDGDNGSGIIVAKRAMERAIEIAKKYNVGIVGVTNSNHFGAAGIYSRMAVQEGMVGISMTNVKPLIAAPGSSGPVVGNNPFSIAIPTYSNFPFVLDMSLSVVARGKFSLAIKKNEKIPTDWATDKYGRPTDDPQEAFDGYLLPLGGYKGLGLAYAVDMLSGLLTGGAFLDYVQSMYEKPLEPSFTSHMMMAVNVDAILGKDEIKGRVKYYHDTIKNAPMWQAGQELFFPGELEQMTYDKHAKEGIQIPTSIWNDLIELGQKLNVTYKLESLKN